MLTHSLWNYLGVRPKENTKSDGTGAAVGPARLWSGLGARGCCWAGVAPFARLRGVVVSAPGFLSGGTGIEARRGPFSLIFVRCFFAAFARERRFTPRFDVSSSLGGAQVDGSSKRWRGLALCFPLFPHAPGRETPIFDSWK